jgi:hypothetical protein
MRRRAVVVLAATALAGVALPFMVDRAGRWVGPRLGPGTDSAIALVVAEEARFGAAMLDRGPARVISPVHVVTRVWRDPGHCSDPNPGPPVADYRATVVALTWFALPIGTMDVSCGGWLWSRAGKGR